MGLSQYQNFKLWSLHHYSPTDQQECDTWAECGSVPCPTAQSGHMQSRSPVAAQWRCASGETAARCGAAARRCSPARRWRRARPGRGSGSGGSWRGFPRASGSLERDPPSTAAAHRASPEGRITGGDRGRDTEVFSTQVTKEQVFQEVSSAFTQSILYLKYLLILKQVWVTETKYSQEASKMKKIRCNTMIRVIKMNEKKTVLQNHFPVKRNTLKTAHCITIASPHS